MSCQSKQPEVPAQKDSSKKKKKALKKSKRLPKIKDISRLLLCNIMEIPVKLGKGFFLGTQGKVPKEKAS